MPIDKSQLKRAVDMVKLCTLLGIEAKRVGSGYMALCPLHADKNPSLSINPKENLWHCFGCGKGGDAIKLVELVKSMSFSQAMGFLTDHFGNGKGISPSKFSETAISKDEERDKCLQKAMEYYHRTLKSTKTAMDYMNKRGITRLSTLSDYKIGYCDRTLRDKISDKERDILLDAGLFRDNANKSEHFSTCITIPIFSVDRKVVGCYGRRLRNRESEGFASHLYLRGPHQGVFNADKAFAGENLILTEALFDALSFINHSMTNVTSSYGTNGFTAEHLKLLRQSGVKRLFVAYDNDPAGEMGYKSLLSLLKDDNIEIYRVEVPIGKDVNEYMLSYPEHERGQMLIEVINNARKSDMKNTVVETTINKESKIEIANKTPKQETLLVTSASESVLTIRDRVYRLRGIDKNKGHEHLKVNIKLSKGDRFHLDIFDLYSAKQRLAFMRQASLVLNIDDSILLKDMSILLTEVEKLHDVLLAEEINFAKPVHVMSEEEEQEALTLLKNPKMIDETLEDFMSLGYVGEDMNKVVGYIATRSCKMDSPISILVQSRSAAGKSSLQDVLLKLVPEEDQMKFTAMTGQSLFYMGEDSLKHKVLAVSENEGASGASYALKTMQSEGELKIASTGKDVSSGKMKTHEYLVKGPLALILTTTEVEIDYELANRFITLTVDEDIGQTKRIHEQQRFEQTLEGILTKRKRDKIAMKHKNAMRLLRNIEVVNPFAKQLTFYIEKLIARRDHKKYLNLINGICFLFQHQRELKHRDDMEYIEVTLDDIRLANKLGAYVLARSMDELSPPSRTLLDIILKMVEKRSIELNIDRNEIRFTRKEIRDYCNWDHWQVRDHIRELEELEFIVSAKGRRGQRYEYVIDYDPKAGKSLRLELIDANVLLQVDSQGQAVPFETES